MEVTNGYIIVLTSLCVPTIRAIMLLCLNRTSMNFHLLLFCFLNYGLLMRDSVSLHLRHGKLLSFFPRCLSSVK